MAKVDYSYGEQCVLATVREIGKLFAEYKASSSDKEKRQIKQMHAALFRTMRRLSMKDIQSVMKRKKLRTIWQLMTSSK